MNCTAHAPTAMQTMPPGKDTPCERELGHGGLHCYTWIDHKDVRWVAEFTDAEAVFHSMEIGR